MEYNLKSTRDGELIKQKVGLSIVRLYTLNVQFYGGLKNVYLLMEKLLDRDQNNPV